MKISDLIVELHKLSNTIEDSVERFNVKQLANELAIIGNRIHEKELEVSNDG
jgi:hypothetical protein